MKERSRRFAGQHKDVFAPKRKMNAILKYPGSKWSIANWIISHFPEHHSYLEPFFGSGAVISMREYAEASEKSFKKVEEWRKEN